MTSSPVLVSRYSVTELQLVKWYQINEIATGIAQQRMTGVPSRILCLLTCQEVLNVTSRLMLGQICLSCILARTLPTPWCPEWSYAL